MIKKTIYIIPFVFFLLIGMITQAQSPEANIRIDSNNILIGDQSIITLEYINENKEIIEWPVFNDTIIKNIEIISKTPVDTIWLEDKKTWKFIQKFTVTSFDEGDHVVPSIKFIYDILPDSSTLFTQTDPLLLMVNTIEIDTSQAIKDIKEPIEIPITFKEVYPWVLGGIGIIALIVGILYFIRKRRNASPITFIPNKPEIPPHIIALKELDILWNEKLWQKNNIKEYHSRLTDITRTYIGGKFKVNAMEMTTDEVFSCFETINIDEELKSMLYKLLTLADLVKFAKAKPLPTEHDISFSYAKDFITKTITTNTIIDNTDIENEENTELQILPDEAKNIELS